MSTRSTQTLAPPIPSGSADRSSTAPGAPFGPTLALTTLIAIGGFLLVMPLVLLVIHPRPAGFGALAGFVNQQNQGAKTLLYVGTFAILVPLALLAVPRIADKIAAGPNGPVLPALTALLYAALALAVLLVKASPWSDRLTALLVAAVVWSALALAALLRASRPRPWPRVLALNHHERAATIVAAALVFGTVLCVTHLGSLNVEGIVVAAIAAAAVLALRDRVQIERLPRPAGLAIDAVVALIVALAAVNVVVFTATNALPNLYFPPGVIQFQQDWILGPANQLLRGGALLVNEPVSQYGVGLLYGLAAWFHIAPIGYGTFGLLDGILTALVYVGGYAVLRLAGTNRLLAAAAVGLAVTAFLFNLRYPVGALPEQGPLRFGVPMAVIVLLLAGERWPGGRRLWRGTALVLVGVSSIWALEAFAYTAFTFLAMVVVEACLRPAPGRARWLGRQILAAVLACLTAHVVFAAATLIGSGQLPHWGQYLAYVRGLLLGGKEGSVTYGFDPWSPGLLVGAVSVASVAAIVLLLARLPTVARRERPQLLAVAGTTTYAIAAFSYTDNRSSTYLLLYASLPALLTGALWLSMLLRSEREAPSWASTGGLAFALALAGLMIAAAWPSVHSRFTQSALAHAYPGGGLAAHLRRLWHPPPIDPRATAGGRLLTRYFPGRHATVVLAGTPDLGIESLMRSGKANALFVGDPSEDVFVPAVWQSKLTTEIAALRPGELVLTDRTALRVTAQLRGRPDGYPLDHPVDGGNGQVQWILHAIDRRFALQPVASDSGGLVVARLRPRG